MLPTLWQFELFGLRVPIHAFGTLIVVAFLVSTIYVRRRAAREFGLDKEWTFNICFVLLFLGGIGARLLYVLIHYDVFSQEALKFAKIWEGGFFFYGWLFAVLLGAAWYVPRHRELKGWSFFDLLVLGIAIGVFIGRWGSFLSGENYGVKAPDLLWAVRFPPVEGSAVPAALRGVDLHPTQLYHSLHGLIIFAFLWFYLRRKPWPGRATGLFLMLYAIGTAAIGIWRGDWQWPPNQPNPSALIEGVVSWNQFLSIPVFFTGIAIFLVRKRPTEG